MSSEEDHHARFTLSFSRTLEHDDDEEEDGHQLKYVSSVGVSLTGVGGESGSTISSPGQSGGGGRTGTGAGSRFFRMGRNGRAGYWFGRRGPVMNSGASKQRPHVSCMRASFFCSVRYSRRNLFSWPV